MSTAYAASIDMTGDSAKGTKFSAIAGGSITAGMAVKWDASTAKTVVVTTANSSICIGIARDTVVTGDTVCILGNNCKVKVPYTLTLGGRLGCAAAGAVTDYSANTSVGVCETAAASASTVRVKLQY